MRIIPEQPRLIGVCLSTIHDENRFDFIKELNRHAVKNGCRLLIFNSCTDLFEQNNKNNDGEVQVFQLIPYDMLSALIIFPSFLFNEQAVAEIIRKSHEHNVPVISLDKEMEGCINFSFSYGDTFEMLCRHIIEVHGAKEIFMLAGYEDNEFSNERIAGFKRALEKNGIPFNKDNIGYGGFWDGPTLDVLERWFVTEGRMIPDAIVCANDTMAIAASSYLQKMGCEIPEECMITGFDGIMQARYHIPHITTCKQDYDRMSELIIDTICRLDDDEDITGTFRVDFNIIYSQSCGCQPIGARNVNDAVQSLIERLARSSNRQHLMCTVQSSISKMKDITELPHILIDKFQFHTCAFAVNEDIFSPPDFGLYHTGEKAFSENVHFLYHRYFWNPYDPCTISRRRLLPDMTRMTNRTDPMIVCCVHFIDLVMGYCVFQPEIDIDEYQKMHTLMSAINASLGSFHGRLQIGDMNDKLISANDELKRLSVHDFMTGLYNRRGFFDELDLRIKRDKGSGVSVVLISADLDGLKYINDNFGHAEGDNAIITIARCLMQSSDNNEICARFGGDEFAVAAVIKKGGETAYAERFRKQLFSRINAYNESSGKPYPVEASIGWHCEALSGDVDVEALIRIADDRMYQDKISRKKERR